MVASARPERTSSTDLVKAFGGDSSAPALCASLPKLPGQRLGRLLAFEGRETVDGAAVAVTALGGDIRTEKSYLAWRSGVMASLDEGQVITLGIDTRRRSNITTFHKLSLHPQLAAYGFTDFSHKAHQLAAGVVEGGWRISTFGTNFDHTG